MMALYRSRFLHIHMQHFTHCLGITLTIGSSNIQCSQTILEGERETGKISEGQQGGGEGKRNISGW